MFLSAFDLLRTVYAARFLALLRPRAVRDVELVARAGAFLAGERTPALVRVLLVDAVRLFCFLLRPACELVPRTVLEPRRLRVAVPRVVPLCRFC
jgi:hypothetical protein